MATFDLHRLMPRARPVPLAWRNLVANKMRLVRSSAGIAFAVLLMMVQLGFERGFFDASLAAVRALDGDLFVMSAVKYRFGTRDPFPRRDFDLIHSFAGVASTAPLYAGWQDFFWISPVDQKPYLIRVFAFDPAAPPVFGLPDIADRQDLLKRPDTVLVDRRARAFLGMDGDATETKINDHPVHIVGSFALGPDFISDGTVVMSADLFARLLSGGREGAASLPVEAGVVRVRPGQTAATVADALRAALPASLMVMTKAELVAFERKFAADLSSAGPIFWLGTIVGFVVGVLISYQIIYTDLSDQLPQYATLKAMGYDDAYLVRTVLAQAVMTGMAGYLPAWLLSLAVFQIVGRIALLPLRQTVPLTLLSLSLTLGMCLLAGALAVRRAVAVDPAEVF
jgi:putative ABC transport system permease protein